MSPRIYMDLVEALMFKGYSYDDAGPLAYELMSDPSAIVDIPDFIGPPRSDDLSMQAEGGRVGMQEGGTPDYGDIVKTIMDSFPPPDQQEIRRGSPQVEALQAVLGPQLAKGLGTPISPTGGTTFTGETYGSFLPTVAPQTQAQLDAFRLAQEQATGGPGGVAAFQPFLDQAKQFQTDAATALTTAAGLTGPTAFQQFLSPYQQQVIDATLSDFDKQAAIDRARTMQQAGMGTVGNLDAGRFGVQLAEQGAQSNLDRAALQARLLQSGFTQASDLANSAFEQQRGLASLQPSLASSVQQQLGGAGTGALAFQQALLDAEQQRQQLAYQEPLSRIQALGSGLASQVGGVPTTTQTLGTPAPQASPLSQALQVGLTAYGLGSLFGRG